MPWAVLPLAMTHPLSTDVYVFRFHSRAPVVVAWTGGEAASLDLSTLLGSERVRATRLIVSLGSNDEPIGPSIETPLTTAVPIGAVPVFVEPAPSS